VVGGTTDGETLPDCTGRTFVVTGGNSGLGFETGCALALQGGRVVLACRNEDKARDAVERIRAEAPGAAVEARPLDLASLESVRRFAEAWGHAPLDVLVNNAGVMALPRRKTADGFEMQIGTNHLGHFALTGRMLPRLLERSGARVVTVSSTMHRLGRMDFDDLMGERRYGKWRAYGQSKLANLLFTLELQQRLDAAGADVLACAAHPGYAATNLQATGPRMENATWMERVVALGNRLFAQSAAEGARPILHATTALDVRGGDYFGPSGVGEMWGAPKRVGSSHAARDRATALRLWEVSESLTGVRFPI
jgi:NAD(P)-dependent dehydrogenase (short-subunit alcohol dehydrogenase family)